MDFKTLKCWDITNNPISYSLDSYQTQTLQLQKKTVFLLKTNNGVKEIDFNGNKMSLIFKVMELTGLSFDEAMKLVRDKSNYREK